MAKTKPTDTKNIWTDRTAHEEVLTAKTYWIW